MPKGNSGEGRRQLSGELVALAANRPDCRVEGSVCPHRAAAVRAALEGAIQDPVDGFRARVARLVDLADR